MFAGVCENPGWFQRQSTETWLSELFAEGPAVITIHARTRKEMSKVPARWEEVKRGVEIRNRLDSKTLILGNGDVMSVAEAGQRALETGCDGVMLGRAIFGDPWLFSGRGFQKVDCSPQKIPINEKLAVLVEHAKLFEELLGSVKN